MKYTVKNITERVLSLIDTLNTQSPSHHGFRPGPTDPKDQGDFKLWAIWAEPKEGKQSTAYSPLRFYDEVELFETEGKMQTVDLDIALSRMASKFGVSLE